MLAALTLSLPSLLSSGRRASKDEKAAIADAFGARLGATARGAFSAAVAHVGNHLPAVLDPTNHFSVTVGGSPLEAYLVASFAAEFGPGTLLGDVVAATGSGWPSLETLVDLGVVDVDALGRIVEVRPCRVGSSV